MKLEERLREIRKEHKLTQQELAEALGIDRTAYTYYEIGKTMPSPVRLCKLARIYNVTVGYLLGVEDNRPELIRKQGAKLLSAAADPIALLPKEERRVLMWYRLLDEKEKEKLGELMRDGFEKKEKS